MSSREANIVGRFLAHGCGRGRTTVFAVGLAASILGACGGDAGGFQPLYGPVEGQTYDQRLATVEVATIPGRVGQRIRNELVFERSTGEKAAMPERRLDVIITETLLTTLVSADMASRSDVARASSSRW